MIQIKSPITEAERAKIAAEAKARAEKKVSAIKLEVEAFADMQLKKILKKRTLDGLGQPKI
jgi:hypothetical protein